MPTRRPKTDPARAEKAVSHAEVKPYVEEAIVDKAAIHELGHAIHELSNALRLPRGDIEEGIGRIVAKLAETTHIDAKGFLERNREDAAYLSARFHQETMESTHSSSFLKNLEDLHIADLSDRDLAMAVRQGLPSSSAIKQLIDVGFNNNEINRVAFRHNDVGHELSVDQGDRVARMLRVASLAHRVFGDRDKTWRWLRSPKKAFEGIAPIDMLDTEHGGREVENMIRRIEHGMAA